MGSNHEKMKVENLKVFENSKTKLINYFLFLKCFCNNFWTFQQKLGRNGTE